MKTPNVGDVVTVVVRVGKTVRAEVRKSYKRRFAVVTKLRESDMDTVYPFGRTVERIVGESIAEDVILVERAFERAEEGKTWVRGWDDETALAFRAEKALASCR